MNQKSNLDDLISIIEQEEETFSAPKKIFKPRNSVLKFIKEKQIAPGTNRVPTYVIFHQFALWTRQFNSHYLCSKIDFFRTFAKYYDQVRSGVARYYLIEGDLDLSKEAKTKAKKYDQKWQKRKKKKI